MIHSAKKQRKKPLAPADVIARRIERIRSRADWLHLIGRLLLIGALGWLFFTQVLLVTQAKGQNMFPAVKDGDLVIAYRLQREREGGDRFYAAELYPREVRGEQAGGDYPA